MYTFLRATKNRLEPVRTDSVACGFKRFFLFPKSPNCNWRSGFFAVQSGSVAVFFRLCEPDLQTLPALASGIAPASPGFIDNQDGLILDSFESISMPESKYCTISTDHLRPGMRDAHSSLDLMFTPQCHGDAWHTKKFVHHQAGYAGIFFFHIFDTTWCPFQRCSSISVMCVELQIGSVHDPCDAWHEWSVEIVQYSRSPYI